MQQTILRPIVAALVLLLITLSPQISLAQPGMVLDAQKISDTEGDFLGTLGNHDNFGHSVASLGDLDGDGILDLAVGAYADGDGGTQRGAVWILFLNANGTVKSHQKISDTQGGFTGVLRDKDVFGISVANLGDLDGDTITDIAVGAFQDDDGGSSHGAVWILFLNTDGTVKGHQKISDTAGNFTGHLDDNDKMGGSIAAIGDLDGDTVTDIAVGSNYDDDGGPDHGAVWILFLNSNGTVKGHQKISDTEGNFTGDLDDVDNFSLFSISALGDLDGDAILDIAVGAQQDDDGGDDRGALWILFLNADGTVKNHQKISDTAGNFTGILDDSDRFGCSITSMGDIDGDGIKDIAVGAWLDDDGVDGGGAVWILFLNTDGSVKGHQKISMTKGNFTEHPGIYTKFGISATSLGDLDGDGKTDLAVGASSNDDGGANRGAAWILFMDDSSCKIPLGDFDENCRIDIGDFSFLANRWMLDCQANPDDPACVPHDFCRDAIEVFDTVAYNGTTEIATGTDLSSCGALDSEDVWHFYTPIGTGTATFSLCGSGLDTTLTIYDGCGGSELACNDDFCGDGSQVEMEVTAGQSYYLRVAGNNHVTGTYTLNVSLVISVIGDDCGDAILVSENVTYNGATTGATGATTTSCSSNDTADVWHSYTASGNGVATFSLCGSGFDTSLAVFDGCGGSELACNDDFCSVQSKLTLSVLSGMTYLVRVAGFEGDTGDYQLLVTETHPVNDNCSDPNVVITGVPFIGSSVDAAGTDMSSCGTDDRADVWLSYTASVTATVVINLCGSDFDTTLAVFDSCGGTELVCNDDSCETQSKVSLAATSGTTYYLRIAGNNGATGNYTVNIIE